MSLSDSTSKKPMGLGTNEIGCDKGKPVGGKPAEKRYHTAVAAVASVEEAVED